MGQIALAYVRNVKGPDLRLKPDLRREVGELAKELGIDLDRVMVFMQIIACEQFEKTMFEK